MWYWSNFKAKSKIKRSVDSKHSLGVEGGMEDSGGVSKLGCPLLIHKQRHVTVDHAALASCVPHPIGVETIKRLLSTKTRAKSAR